MALPLALNASTTAAVASALLRVGTYFFLRWAAIPWVFKASLTLFAIYIPAFFSSYRAQPKYAIVDNVNVTVTDEVVNKEQIASGETDRALVAEQVQVQEKISLERNSPGLLSTLVSGIPNPNNVAASILTLLVNLACVAMAIDMIYSPRLLYPSHELSFARVGYVSHTEAKLLIREPDQSKMPITIEVHIKDAKAPFDNPLWQTAGGVKFTTNETDYTAVVDIPLSHSSQRTYEWRTSNNHTGEFVGAPKPGKMPEVNGGKFTFLSTSCVIPRIPYNPLDHPIGFPGMRHLAKLLPTLGAQFMLFLGDFIYIDVPRQFGESVENYRQKYRQVYASPDWPAIGQNLSWIHVLDDHEIKNDWDKKSSGVYNNAVEPWHHYQTAVNPPLAKRAGAAGKVLPRTDSATYFSFVQGPASFFMMDTRSYRSDNSEPFASENKTMLGETQLEDFVEWLGRPEPKGVKWKIIASSVPFTKNWHVNTRDTWGGFLAERRRLLEAMWDAGMKQGVGIIILSGDRHEFGATAFPPPKDDSRWTDAVTVHEFSASPLNQFYSPVPTYWQSDDEDVTLKYINKGNSKFGSITIEQLAEGEQSSLHYTVYIDGAEAWDTVVVSPLAIPAANNGGSFWSRWTGS